MKKSLSVLSFLFFSACSSQERAEQALSLGWVGPTGAARAHQTTVKPLYCYRTLGAPECYENEQEEWDHRLIHFYAPQEKEKTNLPVPESALIEADAASSEPQWDTLSTPNQIEPSIN